MSSSKPKTAETILREALRDIVNEVCTRPSCGSVQREAIYGTANNALAEAANASPWIEITDETMPGDDADLSRPTHEIANKYLGVLCNVIDGKFIAINPRAMWTDPETTAAWPMIANEPPTHYRKIELPPLPGSEE